MENKILSLAPDEEVQVIGQNCKSLLKVKNSQNELNISEEIDNIDNISNIEITTFGSDDLRLYATFASYYELAMNIIHKDDLPNDIEDCIIKLMHYHENKVFSRCGDDLDVDDYEYQCIIYNSQ